MCVREKDLNCARLKVRLKKTSVIFAACERSDGVCVRAFVRVRACVFKAGGREQERVGGAESAPVQSGPPGKASPMRSSLPQPAENSETLP